MFLQNSYVETLNSTCWYLEMSLQEVIRVRQVTGSVLTMGLVFL